MQSAGILLFQTQEKEDLPGRHPCLELHLAIADAVADLGRQTRALHGREDDARARVAPHDAVWSGDIRGGAGGAEVEGVAVGDVVRREDLGREGRDDVERVVIDEGVPRGVGRPVELAVPG